MDRIWLHAPTPALCVRSEAAGTSVQFNEAARQWLRQTGTLADELRAWATRHAARVLALPPGDTPAPDDPQPGPLRLRCTTVPLRDSGSVLLWLQPDEGAEAAAQAQTRRAAEFLDRALVLAGVSVWRIDLDTRRAHFNAIGFQATGVAQDPAGIDLDLLRAMIHPDDAAAVVRGAEQAIASDRVVDVVARYRNPDGSWRTLLTRRVAERDDSGRAVSLAGVSIDLSRHLAERERNEALAEQARLVTEALGVGFWSRDIDGERNYWDDAMHRLHGRARELGPPQGGEWLEICVHPQDRAWLAERARLADLSGEPLMETLFRAPDRDGAERWIQSFACRATRGGRRMAYGMHIDATERKRAEALRVEKQRLEQASREKSAFMARMSHELRTPMNAVLGFTQLLQSDRESPPSARQSERLAHIGSAGQQLMTMIDGLLEIARREAPLTPAQPAAGLHVLCVEDNPVNLQLVRELIALRPQVRLRTAEDGLSGVQAALSEPPDLLLLDLQLPDIDGLEVMRRVRADASNAGTRIVALSADAMPDHIEAAMAAGFDDYWTKPIQFDNFLAHIDRLAAGLGSHAP